MDDNLFIELVAGERTQFQDRYRAGDRIPVWRGAAIPAPGTAGRLCGIPGVMRAELKWEMTEPAPISEDPGPPWARALSEKLDRILRLLDTPE